MFPMEYMVIATGPDGERDVSFYEELGAAAADAEVAGGQVFEVRKIMDFEMEEEE